MTSDTQFETHLLAFALTFVSISRLIQNINNRFFYSHKLNLQKYKPRTLSTKINYLSKYNTFCPRNHIYRHCSLLLFCLTTRSTETNDHSSSRLVIALHCTVIFGPKGVKIVVVFFCLFFFLEYDTQQLPSLISVHTSLHTNRMKLCVYCC